jgi:hypothetical protein
VILVLASQVLGEHDLLGCGSEWLEIGVVFRSVELLRNAGHDLLERPGFLVIAKVEDALHETGGMPPGCQVAQQRGFARAAHTP